MKLLDIRPSRDTNFGKLQGFYIQNDVLTFGKVGRILTYVTVRRGFDKITYSRGRP